MNEYVIRKFPSHVPVIKALASTDATFREMINDHEEMCRWLEAVERGPSPDCKELDHARALISNLENEILTHLGNTIKTEGTKNHE